MSGGRRRRLRRTPSPGADVLHRAKAPGADLIEAGFGQVSALAAMRFVDGCGRRLEVIRLDRGGGPQDWIRVTSRHGYLIGDGYYRRPEDALALVDVESLVEVIPLRP